MSRGNSSNSIAYWQSQYRKAKAEGDYEGMRRAHRKANQIRMSHGKTPYYSAEADQLEKNSAGKGSSQPPGQAGQEGKTQTGQKNAQQQGQTSISFKNPAPLPPDRGIAVTTGQSPIQVDAADAMAKQASADQAFKGQSMARVRPKEEKITQAQQRAQQSAVRPVGFSDGLSNVDLLKFAFTDKEYDLPSWNPYRLKLTEQERQNEIQRRIEFRQDHPILNGMADNIASLIPGSQKVGTQAELKRLGAAAEDYMKLLKTYDALPYRLSYVGTELAQYAIPYMALAKYYKGAKAGSTFYKGASRLLGRTGIKSQTADAIINGMARSAKMDLTLGAAMDTYKGYTRGHQRTDLLRYVGENTAKNLLVGSALEALPFAYRGVKDAVTAPRSPIVNPSTGKTSLVRNSVLDGINGTTVKKAVEVRPGDYERFKQMTPEDWLAAAQEIAESLSVKHGRKVQLPEHTVELLLDAKTPSEVARVERRANEELWNQKPADVTEKINGSRDIAQMMNLKGHVVHLLENATFVPLRKMKDVIAASIEGSMQRLGKMQKGDRTKAILNPFNSRDRHIVNFADNDFYNVRDLLLDEKALASVKRPKTAKVFQNPYLETTRAAAVMTSDLLNRPGLRTNYRDALSGWIKARGVSPESMPETLLWEGRYYSMQEADRAVFRDTGALASALTHLESEWKRSNQLWKKAAGNTIELMVPPLERPMNILKRGVEYSPVGLLNGLNSVRRMLNGGRITAAQAIDQIAAGMTGTAVMALGAWLGHLGIAKGSSQNPYETRKGVFDKMLGEQEYSLNFGDQSYPLEEINPASIPFFLGVELDRVFANQNYEFEDLIRAISKVSEPQLNSFISEKPDGSDKVSDIAPREWTEEELAQLNQICTQIAYNALERLFASIQYRRMNQQGKSQAIEAVLKYAMELKTLLKTDQIPSRTANTVEY